MSHRLKPSPCPYCGRVNDAGTATDGTDVVPRPGDIAICIECVEISVYDEQMNLQKPPEDFLKEMEKEHPEAHLGVMKARLAVLLIKQKRINN